MMLGEPVLRCVLKPRQRAVGLASRCARDYANCGSHADVMLSWIWDKNTIEDPQTVSDKRLGVNPRRESFEPHTPCGRVTSAFAACYLSRVPWWT